jgi:hypothetical protein
MTPCSVVEVYRPFRGRSSSIFTIEFFYSNIPEDYYPHSHLCENLKSEM